MVKEWVEGFSDLFRIQNVSNDSHLLGKPACHCLSRTYILAALPHLQTTMDLGHSVQFPLLRLFHHVGVVFSVSHITYWVSTSQNPIIHSSTPPYNHVSLRVSQVGFDCPQPISSGPSENLGYTLTPYGMEKNMSHTTVERSVYFEDISSC